MTAEGLSGTRPFIAFSRRNPSLDSGSVANPYTVSAGNSATPPTAMQRSKVATSCALSADPTVGIRTILG